MSTKSTPEVYLSNFLFWQSYHGWVTFRFPVFPLSWPKLFWYENKQLYTYLPVTASFCPQGLYRDFSSTYLPVIYWSFLVVVASVLFLFLPFSKFRNTVLTLIVCNSGLAGGHSFTWPLAMQSQHGQLGSALSFIISCSDNSHRYEVLTNSFLA